MKNKRQDDPELWMGGVVLFGVIADFVTLDEKFHPPLWIVGAFFAALICLWVSRRVWRWVAKTNSRLDDLERGDGPQEKDRKLKERRRETIRELSTDAKDLLVLTRMNNVKTIDDEVRLEPLTLTELTDNGVIHWSRGKNRISPEFWGLFVDEGKDLLYEGTNKPSLSRHPDF